MKKIIFISMFIFLAATPHPALAQLFLEEGKVNLTVNPSDNINRSLLVHNTSDKPAKVRVYWEDFEYVAPFDASKKFYPAGGVKNSASSWVNFTPREFVLPPFGKQEISYIVNVPPVVNGGYYGVIFFEKAPEEASGLRGLNIVTRVGCLFFIESADKKKEAELQSIEFKEGEFKSQFVNKGNVILIPQGVYYVLDADGKAVDRGTVNNIYVPPQATADYHFPIKKDWDSGRYTLVLTMDLSDGDVLVKEIDFKKSENNQLEVLDTR